MSTKYRYLTDDELVRVLRRQCDASPVIDELCERLAAAGSVSPYAFNSDITCPTCEAHVSVQVAAVDHDTYTCELEAVR